MMNTITFKTSDGPDVSFIGQFVADDTEQSVTTAIYDTQSGNWFVAITNSSNILIVYRVIENKSVSDLIDFLGHTDGAERLYKKLGIDTTQHPD
ncbi:hypothetical protein ACMYSK_07150 [Klebsiella sp. I138]|uniref:hypothetical protein n=1 Tax=Klebsiella sp. I138 TaxID=2755385 RepID=UPI003DA89195